MYNLECLTKSQYDFMKGELSRLLSEEIAKQEKWEKQDTERFGESKINRAGFIEEIKVFMEHNNIEFREDFYFNELYR